MRFVTRVFGIAMCGLFLCTGCGQEAPKSKVTPEQYDLIWGELMANVKKKHTTKKYTDEVLRKYSLNDGDWSVANTTYGGMPAKYKAEYEKSMSIPKPTGNPQAQQP